MPMVPKSEGEIRHSEVLPSRSLRRCCHQHDSHQQAGTTIEGRCCPVERPEQFASSRAEMIPARRRHGTGEAPRRTRPKGHTWRESSNESSLESTSLTLVGGEPRWVFAGVATRKRAPYPHKVPHTPPVRAFRHMTIRRPSRTGGRSWQRHRCQTIHEEWPTTTHARPVSWHRETRQRPITREQMAPQMFPPATHTELAVSGADSTARSGACALELRDERTWKKVERFGPTVVRTIARDVLRV